MRSLQQMCIHRKSAKSVTRCAHSYTECCPCHGGNETTCKLKMLHQHSAKAAYSYIRQTGRSCAKSHCQTCAGPHSYKAQKGVTIAVDQAASHPLRAAKPVSWCVVFVNSSQSQTAARKPLHTSQSQGCDSTSARKPNSGALFFQTAPKARQ
jgi:hypothetical protein